MKLKRYFFMSDLNLLVQQVDGFIRKYYKNRLLRGVLLFLTLATVSFLLVVGLEYVGRFSSTVRLVLILFYGLANLLLLIYYFIIPLAKLFSFGKCIDRYQAAVIIGKFFPDVNDKLLNTLQLKDKLSDFEGNVDFLKASIEQNSKKLSVFSFSSAVQYNENRKYLFYLIPVFIVFFTIALFIPSFFKDGTERLIKYNQKFVAPAPFSFQLLNNKLEVEEGEGIKIEVNIEANENGYLPDRVFINSSQGRFILNKEKGSVWTYTFDKLMRDVNFSFEALGHNSQVYAIDVFGKSFIANLNAELIYPSYLGKSNQIIKNISNVTVPEGTHVILSGKPKNVNKLYVSRKDDKSELAVSGFKFDFKVLQDELVHFELFNDNSSEIYDQNINIQVIKDEYPKIALSSFPDSLDKKRFYLEGNASDDYGINKLIFHCRILDANGNERISEERALGGATGTSFTFNSVFDINRLAVELEDVVEYFYVVYDNDRNNGFKSSKSKVFLYKVPSKKDLEKQKSEATSNAKNKLSDLMKKSDDFKKNLDQLRMNILQKSQPSWKEIQQLKDILKQKESLEKDLNKMKEEFNNSFEEQSKFEEMTPEELEQQALLEQLLESIMDDELKELLEELSKLMDEPNKQELNDKLEELEDNTENMDRQMDRTIEMLKQMEIDDKLNQLENDLDELSMEQDELIEDISNKNIDEDTAKEKQKEINEKFNDINAKFEETLEKNENLKRPMPLDDLGDDFNEVEENLSDGLDDMQDGNSGDAKDKQEKASDGMKSLSTKINSMKSKAKKQQQEEDLEALRRLLKNLLVLSFNQEELMLDFSSAGIYDPNFIRLGSEQSKLVEDFLPVRDSLNALADRQPKTSKFISKEITEIQKQFREIPDYIDERKTRELRVGQQFVMTSLNNLTLFLNEALESLQESMMDDGDGEGEGSCDNPGGKGQGNKGKKGSGGMGDLKEMLKKQLEDMQKGKNPNGSQPGDAPGKPIPLPFNSQQAAQMAAQQQAMKRQLEGLKKDLNSKGKKDGDVLNDLLKELEEQQKSLVNKDWTTELIARQKEILTRLLESEKALEERGLDEQRESNSGKNDDFRNQIDFLEYNRNKEKQIELLQSIDLSIKDYYKSRANEYFNRWNN